MAPPSHRPFSCGEGEAHSRGESSCTEYHNQDFLQVRLPAQGILICGEWTLKPTTLVKDAASAPGQPGSISAATLSFSPLSFSPLSFSP